MENFIKKIKKIPKCCILSKAIKNEIKIALNDFLNSEIVGISREKRNEFFVWAFDYLPHELPTKLYPCVRCIWNARNGSLKFFKIEDSVEYCFNEMVKLWRLWIKYKDSICSKCTNKAIYIITFCNPAVILCVDHAPRMANGDPGFRNLTIIHKNNAESLMQDPVVLKKSNKRSCFVCGIKIEDYSLFNYRSIKNYPTDSFVGLLPALPIEEVEYYVCKDLESCSKEQKRLW